MARDPTNEDPKRRIGEAIAEQPYSVDPKKSPDADQGKAGPKRWQKQKGQALPDDPAGGKDGEWSQSCVGEPLLSNESEGANLQRRMT